jgi:hypothetical protein
VYPFLFVALAAALARRNWGKRALAALVLVLMVESLAIWPHYLAFFNGFVGGPDKGPEYLVDSNLDWGQELSDLKQYVVAHQIKRLCVCYFGHARMDYYKLDYLYLPRTDQTDERAKVDCVAAVSATQLMGAYVGEDTFRWLRARKPMAKVGYSIYLYDLRRR